MKARKYLVTLTGETPLILHNDNISWADQMKAWSSDPANRGASTPGDDRTPAFRWMGCLYSSGGVLTVPADNLMTVIREGGKRCPTGKGQTTFKSQTQSGLVVNEADWAILVDGEPIPVAPILAAKAESNFLKHEALAESLGFVLFSKRAKIGTAKHLRVRPRFDRWSLKGSITVFDDMITGPVLQNILTFAGAYAGLGDWRPSSPKSPGPFGKFTAVIEEV